MLQDSLVVKPATPAVQLSFPVAPSTRRSLRKAVFSGWSMRQSQLASRPVDLPTDRPMLQDSLVAKPTTPAAQPAFLVAASTRRSLRTAVSSGWSMCQSQPASQFADFPIDRWPTPDLPVRLADGLSPVPAAVFSALTPMSLLAELPPAVDVPHRLPTDASFLPQR